MNNSDVFYQEIADYATEYIRGGQTHSKLWGHN